jgi:hypothetical protein
MTDITFTIKKGGFTSMKKKLVLSKVTVASLTQENMVTVKGGLSVPHCFETDACSDPRLGWCAYAPTLPVNECPGEPYPVTDPNHCFTADVEICFG